MLQQKAAHPGRLRGRRTIVVMAAGGSTLRRLACRWCGSYNGGVGQTQRKLGGVEVVVVEAEVRFSLWWVDRSV